MSLTEKKIVDKIEVLQNGVIQVREANIIQRDGIEITRTFHRYILNPGDSLSGQDDKIVSIANVIWSEEVVAAYKKSKKTLQINKK